MVIEIINEQWIETIDSYGMVHWSQIIFDTR